MRLGGGSSPAARRRSEVAFLNNIAVKNANATQPPTVGQPSVTRLHNRSSAHRRIPAAPPPPPPLVPPSCRSSSRQDKQQPAVRCSSSPAAASVQTCWCGSEDQGLAWNLRPSDPSRTHPDPDPDPRPRETRLAGRVLTRVTATPDLVCSGLGPKLQSNWSIELPMRAVLH
ncbi:unnamed protein product [Merluccius merluccius]